MNPKNTGLLWRNLQGKVNKLLFNNINTAVDELGELFSFQQVL